MAKEKYKSFYTNNSGETIPVTAEIAYKVPGFFGGLRNAKEGETPTDTIYYIYPNGGMPQKVHRSPYGVTTERMDNSTGEWVPQMYHEYWDDNSVEVEKNKQKIPSLFDRFLNLVGVKQQGGNIQQASQQDKQQLKTILAAFVKGDERQKQQAKQIVEQLMQKNPQGFYQMLSVLESEGDENASYIKQMIDNQTRQAKHGAKLNYIKELKGICPEGYLKTGGRCKPCEAKMKANGDMDPVKSFKAGRKCKRK